MSASNAVLRTPSALSPTNFIHSEGSVKGRIPEYKAWSRIKSRCHNPNADKYGSYGAKGIVVCEGWRNSYVSFLTDMGRRPTRDHSIDRRDNDGNYSCGHCEECRRNGWPANCRWATFRQRQANREQPHECHGLTSNGTISAEYAAWCSLRKIAKRDGIEISEDWLSYRKFIRDVGPLPTPKHRLYRFRIKGAFEKGNAKWLSVAERAEERRKASLHPRIYVRPTHCPHGHKYTKRNTYEGPNGHRYCRTCHKLEGRVYYDSHLCVKAKRQLPLAA
jgi:hypothetical protein